MCPNLWQLQQQLQAARSLIATSCLFFGALHLLIHTHCESCRVPVKASLLATLLSALLPSFSLMQSPAKASKPNFHRPALGTASQGGALLTTSHHPFTVTTGLPRFAVGMPISWLLHIHRGLYTVLESSMGIMQTQV